MARFMRLLMLTRKVDLEDASPAGFTYNWVKKIGEKLEKLYVITWQKSNRGNLPKNIEIISLPNSKFLKVFILQFKLLGILPKIDGIFCHQNPEYTILAAPLAKIFRKKIVSWYAHGHIGWKLYLVSWLTDKILTSSDKGCRLKNREKIEIVGQGIDANYFNPIIGSEAKQSREKFKIISVGRISEAKDYQTLIEAISVLVNEKRIKNLETEIIGAPGLKSQQKYFETLNNLVKDKNLVKYIKFLGPIPHNRILSYYQDCQLFINLSQTGSMDKAVLEAMACQKLVLTSNEAFSDILESRLRFKPGQAQDLANKIIDLINLSQTEKYRIGQQLRKEVIKNHNLDNLVKRIISSYEK